MPLVHRHVKKVRFDDSIPVEVQTYANVEVQRTTLCWQIHGNQKYPLLFKQLRDLLQVDRTGKTCVLGDCSVISWSNGSYSTFLPFVLQHTIILEEAESHPEVLNWQREIQWVIVSITVANPSLTNLPLLQVIRTVNEARYYAHVHLTFYIFGIPQNLPSDYSDNRSTY